MADTSATSNAKKRGQLIHIQRLFQSHLGGGGNEEEMIIELAETGECSHDHNIQWSLEHFQRCLYRIRLETQTVSTTESLIHAILKY